MTTLTRSLADKGDMQKSKEFKVKARCMYIYACYLADELKCFGYKTDCPLYKKSNGDFQSEERFHAAMDRLIDKTRAKHQGLL